VLNGGLDNTWIVGAAVFSLAIGGLLEFRTMEMVSKVPTEFYSLMTYLQRNRPFAELCDIQIHIR